MHAPTSGESAAVRASNRSAKAMNYYQRNFMQYLRSGGWVSIAALPDNPNTKAKVVKFGWVEQRGRGPEVCYRITESGLEALKAPIPLRKST